MGYSYRKASMSNLRELVDVEIQVVRYANQLPEDQDLSDLGNLFFHYYEQTLRDPKHVVLVCLDSGDDKKIIGVGGISFYSIMPTYQNLSGTRAQILNLYTHQDYQGKGIASELLRLLLEEAQRRGVQEVILESNSGQTALYERSGFTKSGNTLLCRLK